MSRPKGITVALAQMAPRLGALEENLERHHELIGAGSRTTGPTWSSSRSSA